MLKILFIQTAFIGDVILATPLIESVLQKYPDALVDIIVRKGNESLLRNFPGLRRIIIWDKKNQKYSGLLKLIKEVRAERYDEVINLQRFASTGLLTAFSHAKVKTGYRKNPFSFTFTNRVEHIISKELPVHEIQRNAQLIRHLGIESTGKPVLFPSPDDYTSTETFKDIPYLCFAPASVWFTKQLPAEQWVKLANTVLNSAVVNRIYLLGGPGDIELCEHIRTSINHPAVINICGSLSFLQTAVLMKDAVMNYVNDSAPLHIASAMNAPVTAFFCSTVKWFGFGPLSDISITAEINYPLYCRPCGLHGYKKCPQGHFKCAHDIDVAAYASVITAR